MAQKIRYLLKKKISAGEDTFEEDKSTPLAGSF